MFQNEMQKRSTSLIASLGKQTASALSGGSASTNVGLIEKLTPAQRAVARQAFADSLKVVWIMYTAFAALGLILSFFIRHQRLSTEYKMTKTGLVEEEVKRRGLQMTKKTSKHVSAEEA